MEREGGGRRETLLDFVVASQEKTPERPAMGLEFLKANQRSELVDDFQSD